MTLPSDRRWAAASARAACTMSSSRLIVVLTRHITASHHDVLLPWPQRGAAPPGLNTPIPAIGPPLTVEQAAASSHPSGDGT
jgi:hypothetical protein